MDYNEPTFLEQKRNEAIAEARRVEAQKAAEASVRDAVRRPVLIDMKQALKCGTSLGRRPRSQYVAD